MLSNRIGNFFLIQIRRPKKEEKKKETKKKISDKKKGKEKKRRKREGKSKAIQPLSI